MRDKPEPGWDKKTLLRYWWLYVLAALIAVPLFMVLSKGVQWLVDIYLRWSEQS